MEVEGGGDSDGRNGLSKGRVYGAGGEVDGTRERLDWKGEVEGDQKRSIEVGGGGEKCKVEGRDGRRRVEGLGAMNEKAITFDHHDVPFPLGDEKEIRKGPRTGLDREAGGGAGR